MPIYEYQCEKCGEVFEATQRIREAEQARAMPPGAARQAVARLAALELDLRVSAQRDFGRSPGDGERLVLETAARDLLALSRGERPADAGRGR